MTLGELQSQFQTLLPDYPYSSYTSTVLQWFNLAQNAIADELVVDDTYTETSSAGQETLTFPDNYIAAKRDGLYVDDDLISIITISEAITQYGTDWKSEGSGDGKFAVDEGSGLTFLPPIEDSGLTIELNYWGRPDALSDSGDYPFTIGTNYHHNLRSLDTLLLDYALAMAEYSLGKHRTIEEALAPFYVLLKEKVSKVKQKPNFERQRFDLDRMYAKRLKNRHGIS
ncbi:MAG: hypothetical protein DRP85_07600 [Candidatus Makaraimicrobium thalassicum]|nr:MAG: hypothetical protein DRP85_07600 [Candidatus Omnitrophota bacterium]